eukprot:TRINITY_DN18180_c0_g1_i1.p1 TRINITY_DN18180_c0_g1~~TRINITY_DN18180_c0_g1_i1.p1  ORF type:complete len:408 (+),score=97.17 TRINITY_DN18180_c0_g1_i1:183-1406(+)
MGGMQLERLLMEVVGSREERWLGESEMRLLNGLALTSRGNLEKVVQIYYLMIRGEKMLPPNFLSLFVSSTRYLHLLEQDCKKKDHLILEHTIGSIAERVFCLKLDGITQYLLGNFSTFKEYTKECVCRCAIRDDVGLLVKSKEMLLEVFENENLIKALMLRYPELVIQFLDILKGNEKELFEGALRRCYETAAGLDCGCFQEIWESLHGDFGCSLINSVGIPRNHLYIKQNCDISNAELEFLDAYLEMNQVEVPMVPIRIPTHITIPPVNIISTPISMATPELNRITNPTWDTTPTNQPINPIATSINISGIATTIPPMDMTMSLMVTPPATTGVFQPVPMVATNTTSTNAFLPPANLTINPIGAIVTMTTSVNAMTVPEATIQPSVTTATMVEHGTKKRKYSELGE